MLKSTPAENTGKNKEDTGIRDADRLLELEDITRLQQYLYLSEGHKVRITDIIGAELELSMDDEGYTFSRNMNFPDLPPMKMTEKNGWSGTPKGIESRWDEIKLITAANVARNRPEMKDIMSGIR